MKKQPETRPISQPQLVAEVKGIYTGLVMVESKCIDVDTAQADASAKTLTDEQWQALIALHRALLHEHHDFFLASQHPSASQALKRLALKYSMPARMWRHGIHSFLELLRKRLPDSIQHMLSFIYLAYSMMGLLYETVPTYKETWIECLGDLGRYRMAIEDENMQDRATWTAVSRHWYSKASDLSPDTGRLYHHLAILARPDRVQQLFYYSKSLCVPIPFGSARESILTLLEPVLAETRTSTHEPHEPIDTPFVQAHACMFLSKNPQQYHASSTRFLESLDSHVARSAQLFLKPAYYIGIANSCALVEYNTTSGLFYNIINQPLVDKREDPSEAQAESGDGAETEGTVVEDNTPKRAGTTRQIPQPVLPATSSPQFNQARELFCDTARSLFQRLGDTNVWPYVHVTLVFIRHLSDYPAGMAHIERAFPWRRLVDLLNTLKGDSTRYENPEFPGAQDKPPSRPLPEDYAMRGLLWVDGYLVNSLFENAEVDDEDKYFEVASFSAQRKERILWLGCQIARANERWIHYDEVTKVFTVAPEFDEEATADADIEIEDAMGTEVQSPKQSPQPSPTPVKGTPKVDLRTLQVKIEVAEEHGEKGKRTTHTPAVQPGPQQGNDLGD